MLRRLGISSVLPKELLLWVVNTTSLNHPEFKANACRAALVRLVLTFWIANLTLQVTSVSVSITPCILFHSEKRTLLGLVELQQAFPVGPLPQPSGQFLLSLPYTGVTCMPTFHSLSVFLYTVTAFTAEDIFQRNRLP